MRNYYTPTCRFYVECGLWRFKDLRWYSVRARGSFRHSRNGCYLPPYFSSHFSSSRTLILPCQGFLSSEWPSPTDRTSVVRFKDEPALGGGERGPLVPVGLKVIAVGVFRASVDEGEHREVLGPKLSGRVDEHSLDSRSVVGGPAVGLALGKGALRE